MSPRASAILGTLLIFPAPLLVELVLLRLFYRGTGGGDLLLIAMLFPFAVLACGLVLVPFGRATKIVLALVLIPCLAIAGLGLGVSYGCAMFGDCL